MGTAPAPTSNWNRLVRTVDPVGDVLALAAAKSHLRVDSDDENGDIQGYIDDAVAQIDGPNGAGLALLTQTWRMSLDHWHGGRIVVPLRPVQAVLSVTYLDQAGDEQTLDPSLYDADVDHQPLEIVRGVFAYWPCHKLGRGVIKVTFRAGFGDDAATVPKDLIGAIKLFVGHRYANREAVVGVENRDSSTALPLGFAETLARYNGGTVA
jgi:uncharacterized phiE125 gp8 family phage protein